MRSLVLIGPPASGKLAIARALASGLGLFLYDNHRSIDAGAVIRKDQVRCPDGLVGLLRRAVIEAAAIQGVPLVFTLVYDHRQDREELDDYLALLARREPPLLVQLHCRPEVAMARAGDPSREGTSKLRSAGGIARLYTEHDLDSPARPAGPDVMHIDSGTTPLAESIRRVRERMVGVIQAPEGDSGACPA